uniref:Uncharacterized protein n=1 Tax=Romanomermis culicivorax TaxID=13658 RepID=A0A915JZ62_ROMCU
MQGKTSFLKVIFFSAAVFMFLSSSTIGVVQADCLYRLHPGAASPSTYREGCGVCVGHEFLRCTNGRMIRERCWGDKWCRQGPCDYNCD